MVWNSVMVEKVENLISVMPTRRLVVKVILFQIIEKTSFAPDEYLSHVLWAKKEVGEQTKRSYNQSASFHKFIPLYKVLFLDDVTMVTGM